MAEPPPIRKRRPVWVISAAVTAIVYVVVIGLVALRQADPGDPRAAELAVGIRTALSSASRQPSSPCSLWWGRTGMRTN